MQQLFDAVGGGGGGGGALVTSGAVAVAPGGGAIIGADGGALLVQQISLLSRPLPVQIITSTIYHNAFDTFYCCIAYI
jgi:predicted ATP-dependent protease